MRPSRAPPLSVLWACPAPWQPSAMAPRMPRPSLVPPRNVQFLPLSPPPLLPPPPAQPLPLPPRQPLTTPHQAPPTLPSTPRTPTTRLTTLPLSPCPPPTPLHATPTPHVEPRPPWLQSAAPGAHASRTRLGRASLSWSGSRHTENPASSLATPEVGEAVGFTCLRLRVSPPDPLLGC